MAIAVQLDDIGTLDLTEVGGVITTAVRGGHITDAGGDTSSPAGITAALAYQALDDAGITVGSLLVVRPGAQLNLVTRKLKQSSDSPRRLLVTLTYEDTNDGGGGGTAIPAISIASGLAQIETENDASGDQIILTHAGAEQGGKIKVTEPQLVIEYPKKYTGAGVIGYLAGFLNKINADTWNQGQPGEWKCTGARLVTLTQGVPPVWDIKLSFTLQPGGHQPDVVYIDPETGKPPPDLVLGSGFKTIIWFDSVQFGVEFPQVSS